jgi:hypothetical protein
MRITTKRRILQHYFCTNHNTMAAYYVFVEIENDKPVATYSIPFPEKFKFYDERYQYYPLNHN